MSSRKCFWLGEVSNCPANQARWWAPQIYNVAKTEGDTITLIATDKSERKVTIQELVTMYKGVDVKQDIVAKSLDALAIETFQSITVDYIGCQAKSLLYDAFRLYQPTVSVDFKKTPNSQQVFAAKKYPTGSLKLVPYSQKLYNVSRKGFEPNIALKHPYIHMQLGLRSPHVCTFEIEKGPTTEKSIMPFEKSLIVPYWLVRRTCNRSRANMQEATLWTNSKIMVENRGYGRKVAIPILQNSKALNVGDELLVFEQKTVIQKRPATFKAQSLPKKRRR